MSRTAQYWSHNGTAAQIADQKLAVPKLSLPFGHSFVTWNSLFAVQPCVSIADYLDEEMSRIRAGWRRKWTPFAVTEQHACTRWQCGPSTSPRFSCSVVATATYADAPSSTSLSCGTGGFGCAKDRRLTVEAHKGDRLIVDGEKVGQKQRSGKILATEGEPTRQRLRVRWEDGHESLFVPGPGVRIERPAKRKT
jgi:hypothetical protein